MPPAPARAVPATVDVTALYAALTRAPLRDEIPALLAGRAQELLSVPDRNTLTAADPAWLAKATQIYDGLLQLCPLAQITTQLAAAVAAPDGVTARRIRYNIARALPTVYGQMTYSLARAMLSAAAEASQDPDVLDAITPATVTAVAPLNGATGVAVDTQVTATFGEPMDATTFGVDTFLLANPAGSPVAATVTYDDATRTARLTPSGALTAGVTYTARLRGGKTEPTIKDAQGVALATDMTWPFTTA
jgi:hypothetical protein